MVRNNDLHRFINAQESAFDAALSEIKQGRKRGHWMWFIFPQLRGLGFSETSQYYGISDLAEAYAYLSHPILGKRLIDMSEALLHLPSDNASQIVGTPDDLKLKSSMTLFASIKDASPVFQAVIDKFFYGVKDEKTLHMLNTG